MPVSGDEVMDEVMDELYEATWWHDSGCYSDTFDTAGEARRKCMREEEMGAYKYTIKRLQ